MVCTERTVGRQPDERNEHVLPANAGSSQYRRRNGLHRKLENYDGHYISDPA